MVKAIVEAGQVAVGDVAGMFKVDRQAALKEMNRLEKLEVVKLVGKGRGAHYVLR